MLTIKIGVGDLDLFTAYQYKLLIENGTGDFGLYDKVPIAHLHALGLNYQWLIAEINVENPNEAYGLIDLNNSEILVGKIDLSEILALRKNGVDIFNNVGFCSEYKLSVFQVVANEVGRIVAFEEGFEDDFLDASLVP
jgi:hypothetical protein